MNDISFTEQLADFVLSVRYDDLPKEIVVQTKLCLVDLLGCVIGASNSPEASIMRSLVAEENSTPQARIPGTNEKASMLNTALATGYIGHIFEMDDVYTPASLHPGNPVISAALPVAAHYHCNGKALIEAIVAGYEVIDQIGESVYPSHYECWHSTATCGCFGAAAAAGKLLGLTREELVWALGNAGTQAAGLWQFSDDGAMSKYLHCGKAAYNGLLSALLAKKGFTGARRILEGKRGFIRGASKEHPPFQAFNGIGDGSYRIMRNTFKAYPSCGYTQTAISAAIDLFKEHQIPAEQIAEVYVDVCDNALKIACNNDVVTHPREAKFSLRYTVASALYNGRVTNETIGRGALSDPKFQLFASKIHVSSTPELTALFPALWVSIVRIQTVNGEEYVREVRHVKGSPEAPVRAG